MPARAFVGLFVFLQQAKTCAYNPCRGYLTFSPQCAETESAACIQHWKTDFMVSKAGPVLPWPTLLQFLYFSGFPAHSALSLCLTHINL